MQVIILLFVCSVFVAGGFLLAFIWNVKNGQYEDEFSSANRILFDDIEKNQQKDKLIS